MRDVGPPPEVAAQQQAVGVGEEHVEDDDVGAGLAQRCLGACSGWHVADRKADGLQRGPDNTGDLQVFLHQQDRRAGRALLLHRPCPR